MGANVLIAVDLVTGLPFLELMLAPNAIYGLVRDGVSTEKVFASISVAFLAAIVVHSLRK
jgi:hypothetical protein